MDQGATPASTILPYPGAIIDNRIQQMSFEFAEHSRVPIMRITSASDDGF
jgi:hypothetical protein